MYLKYNKIIKVNKYINKLHIFVEFSVNYIYMYVVWK
jgi:hypothetical protein